MIAVLITLAVFFGISMCIVAVAASILFANGKLTFPRTSARQLQNERVQLEMARFRLERELVNHNLDVAVEARMTRAIGPTRQEVI